MRFAAVSISVADANLMISGIGGVGVVGRRAGDTDSVIGEGVCYSSRVAEPP
jgi:hypothetical protein